MNAFNTHFYIISILQILQYDKNVFKVFRCIFTVFLTFCPQCAEPYQVNDVINNNERTKLM